MVYKNSPRHKIRFLLSIRFRLFFIALPTRCNVRKARISVDAPGEVYNGGRSEPVGLSICCMSDSSDHDWFNSSRTVSRTRIFENIFQFFHGTFSPKSISPSSMGPLVKNGDRSAVHAPVRKKSSTPLTEREREKGRRCLPARPLRTRLMKPAVSAAALLLAGGLNGVMALEVITPSSSLTVLAQRYVWGRVIEHAAP